MSNVQDNAAHTCSYSCDRPQCIKAQRDELAAAAAQEAVGVDAYDYALDQLWKLAGGNDHPVYKRFLVFRETVAAAPAKCPACASATESYCCNCGWASVSTATAQAVAYMVDGRTEQGLTFDKAAAETMALANSGTVRPLGFVDGTHAAPGIDLARVQAALKYAEAAARHNTHTELAADFADLIRRIDASPKGGSEARDAARYRWLREFAVNGSIGIPFHGWLNCDEPASEWDSAIDAAMQAGDAEVQPCETCGPDGIMATDGTGPFDCYACGKKANIHGAGVSE